MGDTLTHMGKLRLWVIQSYVGLPLQETIENTTKRLGTVVRRLCICRNCGKLESDLVGQHDLEL